MFVLFFLLWVIFNGQWTLEIAIFGVVIAAVMYAFVCKFMDYSMKKDLFILRKGLYIVQYIGVLIKEVIKANGMTIRFLFAGKKRKPQPVLIHFDTTLKTRTARVLLANSITLTPGTITVSLEENHYTVHCLDKSMAEGIDSSVFVRLLTKMEAPLPEKSKKKEGAGNE